MPLSQCWLATLVIKIVRISHVHKVISSDCYYCAVNNQSRPMRCHSWATISSRACICHLYCWHLYVWVHNSLQPYNPIYHIATVKPIFRKFPFNLRVIKFCINSIEVPIFPFMLKMWHVATLLLNFEIYLEQVFRFYRLLPSSCLDSLPLSV